MPVCAFSAIRRFVSRRICPSRAEALSSKGLSTRKPNASSKPGTAHEARNGQTPPSDPSTQLCSDRTIRASACGIKMVVSQNTGTPIQTPKCYVPSYWDPQKGTLHFGKLPHQLCDVLMSRASDGCAVAQRVQSTCMVQSTVSVVVISLMVWVSLPHMGT